MSLLFDVIADLPEGITVMPVFAADKAEALKAGKEPFPGHLVTVVRKKDEPGTSFAPLCPGNEQDRQKLLRAWLRGEGLARLRQHRLPVPCPSILAAVFGGNFRGP